MEMRYNSNQYLLSIWRTVYGYYSIFTVRQHYIETILQQVEMWVSQTLWWAIYALKFLGIEIFLEKHD